MRGGPRAFSLVPMPGGTSLSSKPVLLVTVALILVVVAVVIVRGSSDREGGAADEERAEGGRSSAHSSSGKSSRRADTKGAVRDRTEGALTPGKRWELSRERLMEASRSARTELRDLHAKYRTKFDDPAEQRAYHEKLKQTTSHLEKERMEKARKEAIRVARAQMEASKTQEDRDRQDRAMKVMQIAAMARGTESMIGEPELRGDAFQFVQSLEDLMDRSDELDRQAFNEVYFKLQGEMSKLRGRLTALQGPQP